MRDEPLYGLPVEEYGDVEGWSVNADQPGTNLADAIASELARMDATLAAMEAVVANLPGKIHAGLVAMPASSFRQIRTSFYDGNPCPQFPPPSTCFWRAEESIVFPQSFDTVPTVVVLSNRNSAAGTIVEVTVSAVSQSGFTASLATMLKPVDQWTSGWIAMDRTQ